ncbi:NAD(P)H-hydrate epimerase [Mariniluteicoccus flavus]
MRYAYTSDQVRAAEERAFAATGGDDGRLMQRAAEGLAWAVRRTLRARTGGFRGRDVVLLVGPGNNGGDALYAGVRLLRAGVRVRAWCQSDRFHAAGARAFQAAGGRWIGRVATAGDAIEHADAVVDGIFGIGGRPGLSGDLESLARRAEASPAALVAVDVPSGLGADTGRGDGAFVADLTVTFGALKPCHVSDPGRSACGRVEVVDLDLDLGAPDLEVWEAPDVADAWPWPDASSDKYARGVVGIDAGSARYPGAGLLATGGAVHTGAGMVRFVGDDEVAARVVEHFPNVVPGSGRCQAYLFGPGWGERADGRSRIESVVATGTPCVIDADGLRDLPGRLGRCLLTPHAGELARLLGVERAEVEQDPGGAVRRAVEKTGATVLLKGSTQFVGAPDDPTLAVALPGPAWTAQAGSGDTLAGACATLLAAGLSPKHAAVAAASLQSLTAQGNPGPYPPHELAARFPATVAALDAGELW